MAVAPTVLSVATLKPKGKAVDAIPACDIYVTPKPRFVTSGLPKELEMENASTGRQAGRRNLVANLLTVVDMPLRTSPA